MTDLAFVHQLLHLIPFPSQFNWNSVITGQPLLQDLAWGFIMAMVWSVIRYIIYAIGTPCGRYFMDIEWVPHPRTEPRNTSTVNATEKLEKLLAQFGTSKIDVSLLAKQTGLSHLKIKEFIYTMEQREMALKDVRKWNETLFQSLSYTYLLALGIIVLKDNDWLYDSRLMWKDFNSQIFSPNLRFYYIFELGFYLHCSISHLLLDRRLSDFWVMLAHHCATITLLVHSYRFHFLFPGSVIILVHDCADPFLNWAKLFRYGKYEVLCNVTFAGLIVVWIASRLTVFPYHCIYAIYQWGFTLLDEEYRVMMNFATVFLVLLYCLHWYWFALIIRIAYRAIVAGDLQDERSDKESGRESGLEYADSKHDD